MDFSETGISGGIAMGEAGDDGGPGYGRSSGEGEKWWLGFF